LGLIVEDGGPAVTIPDYQTVMLPLLRLAADDREHFVREAVEELARRFKPS
jgi:restriction system protein